MPPDHNLDDYVDPYSPGHRHSPGGGPGPLRVGLGGPVGSGKTALAAALCRTLGPEYDLAVVTNDIYTTEDADFLRRNAVLPDDRIEAVQTGCCPQPPSGTTSPPTWTRSSCWSPGTRGSSWCSSSPAVTT